MPASEGSLALTDGYRARLLATRQTVTRALNASWRMLDLADLDATYAVWVSALAPTISAAQAAGVALADAYLATYIRSETGRHTPPIGIDPAALAGKDQFDRPLEQALIPPIYTVKMSLADHGAEGALELGLARAARIAAGATLAAPAAALTEALGSRSEVVGYRRATSSNPCGACLAAATGAIQETATTLEPHTHCRCTKEPVIKGVRERYFRPTGQEMFDRMTPAEQDALFHGRGGAEKAELLRSGEITLDDLLTRQPMAEGGAVITETPMSALVTS